MLSIEGIIAHTDDIGRGRIEIDTESGLITKVAEATGTADIVLDGELIFPGFIDLHVHAREDITHSQDYKEDFTSAGEAAINGGVVAFAEMPNCPTPPIDDESYDARAALTQKSPVTIVLYAGIGPETNPLSKKVPYKAFMGHSIGDLFFNSQEELEHAIKRYEGQSVSFHCEDPKIMDEHKGEKTHEKRRPAPAEISAVDFALLLIEKYKLKGKICHASTIEAIEKISAAKQKGISVTVEVTPHHLYFDETMFTDVNRTQFQVNPPIRQTEENRLALIKALRDGKIDYLATDHAPHSVVEKQAGMSGLTELDTYGSFVSWLIYEHGFTADRIVEICANGPGEFINQFQPEKYGKIAEGYVGSLTILNLKEPLTITKEFLKTKCKWSPFEGVEFPGRVAKTIIKGKIYER